MRERRKTLALRVLPDLTVQVKAPLHLSSAEIDAFVTKHGAWIMKRQIEMEERVQIRALTPSEEDGLRRQAAALVPARLAYWGRIMGLAPAGWRITSAKTRWGSCSGVNRLCFSLRAALLPLPLFDYIVVHELAHMREKNHSPAFYAEVARWMPDYRERAAEIRRMEKTLPR